ncbi:MAG: mucoidy inhibitor MuiA family protein [Bacteroidia bacterium]|nr:mucoidy inhibitor MuiA family protein [Bacteroidia bacterium]
MQKFTSLRLWSLIILVFMISHAATAQKTEIEPVSKLQKIIVFTDRALIVKDAVIAVKRGENIVRISGITPNLVDQSVQISLMGQSELAISEVTVEETFLKETEQPKMQKLQSELNNLNNQINDGTNQILTISSAIDFLKKVNPFPQNLKVTMAEMDAHAKYLEKSLTTNLERIAAIQIKIKKLVEEKSALENELAILKSDKNKSKSIIIHLISNADKTGIKIGYTYISTEAGWSSQYEARADFNTSKVDFNYFASIWQSTGEDWTDANVEISTARPFVYGNLPDLNAWYLDVYTPRQYMSKSKSAYEELSAPRAMMERAPAPAAENLLKETEIKEENTSFSFVLPRKVDIVSDGQPHRVSIAKSNADAKYTWFTIPKLVQNAFLKASMKNPFSFPLLSGPISVFFDQKLVGTASVNEVILPEGEMELSLGIDEGIKIERKLQKKYTDYAGVLRKETTVYFEYAIEITNGKSKEITLDLNDQFPLSRNEKIKVEMEAPKGGEATVDDEGKISWKITLAPGAKKSIPLKFSVTYPKDMRISGL